jgi:hypothetical protein
MISRRTNTQLRLLAVLAALAALFLVGCGSDDGDGKKATNPPATEVPKATAAMQGIWNYETIARDCTTDQVVPDLSDSGTDTLCAGDPIFDDEGDDIFVDGCDVENVGANSFSIECVQTESLGGCTVSWSVNWQFSYTNTTITGTGTMSVTYSGTECGDVVNECYNVTTTATRVGSAPPGACPPGAARAVTSRFESLPSLLKKVVNR